MLVGGFGKAVCLELETGEDSADDLADATPLATFTFHDTPHCKTGDGDDGRHSLERTTTDTTAAGATLRDRDFTGTTRPASRPDIRWNLRARAACLDFWSTRGSVSLGEPTDATDDATKRDEPTTTQHELTMNSDADTPDATKSTERNLGLNATCSGDRIGLD